MSPIAYYNFDTITNGQTNDIINNTTLSGVLPNSVGGIRDGYASFTLASGIPTPAINVSGSHCLDVWIMGHEFQKPGYPNYSDVTIEIFRSGNNPLYPPQTDTLWKLSLRNNGDLTWKVGTQTLMKSGVDVGRWNHVYCEYDEPNSRIGLSVNAANKIYANYSGGIPNYQSRLYLSTNSAYGAYCDELGIWSGSLSQAQIEEHYSNFRGYSYSGSLNTQWMYPQSDLYVNSSGSTYDFPSSQGRWYQDEMQMIEVPFTRRWEYINATDIVTDLNAYNSLYSEAYGFSTTSDRKIRAGLGKLLVRPSSVTAYVECQTVQPDYSGYLSDVYLYDKNNAVIASGYGNVYDQKFVVEDLGGGSRGLTYPQPLSLQFIDPENKDFSETSTTFSFKSFQDATTLTIQNVKLLVSGVAVAYTGLNLIGSGGIDKNSHVDLYTQAYSSGFGSKDLYLAGHLADSSGIPLYIYGHQPVNSGVDLYMYGWDTRSSGIDLFIGGHIGLNSGVPLYTYGSNVHNGSMNLFTKYEPVERSGGFDLFTFAADDPTVQKSMDLYLKTALASSVVGNMSLYLAAPDTGSAYSDMPLFLENNTYNYGSVELFLQNAYQSGFKGLRLFTQGAGTLDGGLPYSDTMPLFIERTEGVERGLSMFVMVNSGIGSGLNMFTKGGTYSSSGLDLSIPSTYAQNSGVLKLMIRGY